MATSKIAGLLSTAETALGKPAITRVVGERVRVLSVARVGERGLEARVERKGVTYGVSLADLEVEPGTPLHGVVATYREMLGIDPPVSSPSPGGTTAELTGGSRVGAISLAAKKIAKAKEEEGVELGLDASRLPSRGDVLVDMQELSFALEDHSLGHAWYLDRETGDLHLVSEDLPDEDLLLPEELENNDRYVLVGPEEERRAYRDMEEFAETVREDTLRRRLRDALAGKGAFGRFKNVLAKEPVERERWFVFRNERLELRARDWLEGIGIKPGPRDG